MRNRLLPLLAALSIALSAVAPAHPQASGKGRDTAVLPVVSKDSGKVEAYLVLEPAPDNEAGVRWRFGNTSLDATFGLNAGDSLGLVCKTGIANAIGNLANNCLLAALGDGNGLAGDSRHASATAALNRGNNRFGINAGSGRSTLPAWLTPGLAGSNQVDVNDLTIFAQKNLPKQGFVSIAGTVAKAHLLTPADAEASGLAADHWDTRSLSVGGGFGAFSANIVGHVVDTPGQQSKWAGIGLGLTWRTPWSGQLTVGADNLITRGKNPFSPTDADGKTDDGTVPYVRYEQDL